MSKVERSRGKALSVNVEDREGVEELGDTGSTSKSDPEQRAEEVDVVGALVDEIPWETCEEVKDEARLEVPDDDLVVVEDQGE
ncbi:hypothetical protein LR48_Vigan04g052900 [Vigna angularis]|uniref:Uncharacterized protein n=1 Tax=Phaseolus angularis TaxID=3914 RepID=A0A0L9UC94_PHAAN|nr:hypothetical protein LR48_Vigan04g052900 [Vigna angularis]